MNSMPCSTLSPGGTWFVLTPFLFSSSDVPSCAPALAAASSSATLRLLTSMLMTGMLMSACCSTRITTPIASHCSGGSSKKASRTTLPSRWSSRSLCASFLLRTSALMTLQALVLTGTDGEATTWCSMLTPPYSTKTDVAASLPSVMAASALSASFCRSQLFFSSIPLFSRLSTPSSSVAHWFTLRFACASSVRSLKAPLRSLMGTPSSATWTSSRYLTASSYDACFLAIASSIATFQVGWQAVSIRYIPSLSVMIRLAPSCESARAARKRMAAARMGDCVLSAYSNRLLQSSLLSITSRSLGSLATLLRVSIATCAPSGTGSAASSSSICLLPSLGGANTLLVSLLALSAVPARALDMERGLPAYCALTSC
mmetsp:Transcript_32727/g.79846  ORF Transcript_32727/g.79846 Transcript_32727/m.79846 type:complete len:372 (-) Transcript_32727:1261-2376(-)